MSDLEFESPIVTSYPVASEASLSLTDLSAMAKTIVRAAADTTTAAVLGVAFGASRNAGEILVLGQRPGEWMLLEYRFVIEARCRCSGQGG